MRKNIIVFLLLGAALPAIAEATQRDVNSDGLVDDADVRALARMVTGLDPVDLRFDQNGDSVMDLEDVNLLLDSIPAEGNGRIPSSSASRENTPRPAITGSGRFYALRRKVGGQCLVVVGEEGMEPGDTVFGAFNTFEEAQYQVVSRCNQNGENRSTVSAPLPPPPITPKTSEILAVSISDNGRTTSGIYAFNILTGEGFFLDRLEKKPYQPRKRAMRHGLFEILGTSPSPPPVSGQILMGKIQKNGGKTRALLFVDTRSGKMVYLKGLDVDPTGGRIRQLPGTPAQMMASPDGNYLLLMRSNGSGKTLGAYLYHGTTGECRIFRDIGSLPSNLQSIRTTSLPRISSGLAGCTLQSNDGSTDGFLLLDGSGGRITLVEGVHHEATRFKLKTLSPNLSRSFPVNSQTSASRPFVAVPINDRSEKTSAVLIIQTSSGGLAILRDLGKPSKAHLVGLGRSLHDAVETGSGAISYLTAIPRIDDGAQTKGAWIFSGRGLDALFINGLQKGRNIGVRSLNYR